MQNSVGLETGTSNSARELSPDLWAGFPIGEIRGQNPDRGVFVYEDWSGMPLIPTVTTQIGWGKYKAFGSAGGTYGPVSAVNSAEIHRGAFQVLFDSDDDDAFHIADAYPNYRMSGVPGTDGKLVFEACIAVKSVATNGVAVFIGLGETDLQTLAVALPLNGGDAITADGSMIGFRIEEDGLGVIDTVYSDRATSFTNIGDAEAGTLSAYTFRKVGFVYDPKETDNCVTFYANNQKLTTRLSRTALRALTNLDANALGFLWANCADSTNTGAVYCKWYAIGQLAP